jgi:hypothetical protein
MEIIAEKENKYRELAIEISHVGITHKIKIISIFISTTKVTHKIKIISIIILATRVTAKKKTIVTKEGLLENKSILDSRKQS